MRRSTAAALGTLTGAALIIGVRLSVSAPIVTAAPPAVDLSGNESGNQSGDPSSADANPETTGPTPVPTRERRERAVARTSPTPTDTPTQSSGGSAGGSGSGGTSGLRDGVFRGPAQSYAFGAIQVSIRVSGGKIVAADATYPTQGESASINPPAIATLKRQTLKATSAKDIDTVSGATLTSGAYRKSLQAALDTAGA